MKNINIIAFIVCILLMTIIIIASSCSKPVEDSTHREKSITYLLHVYDEKNQFVKTDTSIHWCKVSGDDLTRFENKSKEPVVICGTNNKLQLVIGLACTKHFD